MRSARVLALLVCLSPVAACGNEPSAAFVAEIKASCEKTQRGKVDCACVAAALDKELDGDSKAALLAINAAIDTGKSEGEAVQAAGLSADDARELMSKIGPALASARAACPRK